MQLEQVLKRVSSIYADIRARALLRACFESDTHNNALKIARKSIIATGMPTTTQVPARRHRLQHIAVKGSFKSSLLYVDVNPLSADRGARTRPIFCVRVSLFVSLVRDPDS